MAEIVNLDNLPHQWCIEEIRDAERQKNRTCSKAEFILQNDGVSVLERFWWKPVDFERIRRITGYIGTIDRFNNAKLAEVRDRVHHI